ncbi:MAG: ECF transporter S component [Firmicutes bacterium]|jgi:riboflavin transporter FmnP|nr:ECF transporter S component [Bacillota bacterium]
MTRLSDTRYLVKVAFLGTLGFLLMYLEFPLPLMPTFLKFDFGDLPALIAGFAYGPVAGLLAEVIKNAIFLLSGRSESGIIGVTANLITGCSLVLTSALVYQRIRTLKGAILALLVGTLTMTATMTIANMYVFFPLWNIPTEQIGPMILGAAIPFNLMKGALTSVATFLMYKRVSAWLGSATLMPDQVKSR